MTDHTDFLIATRSTKPGDNNHRAYVGPPDQYDFMGATQFRLLTGLGLREEHRLLDVGCGSLRAGKLFMQYLLPGRYCGIEPNGWLIDDPRRMEIGDDLFTLKAPRFDANTDLAMDSFGERFDFITAQSIFSHTGAGMMATALRHAAAVLAPAGQFLFTVLDDSLAVSASLPDATGVTGWVYPDCVAFTQDHVQDAASAAGLSAQPLRWFHPRQRWYRAVHAGQPGLSDAQQDALGTGRPLMDDRFAN